MPIPPWRGAQAFVLTGGSSFTAAGQLLFANGVLYGNVIADLAAGFEIGFGCGQPLHLAFRRAVSLAGSEGACRVKSRQGVAPAGQPPLALRLSPGEAPAGAGRFSNGR